MAGFVMLRAKLAQRFGALQVFRAAVVVFGLAQVLMTFSPNAMLMAAAQVLMRLQDWVEKKVRCHLMKARKRQRFGWTRWSRQWLYENLKLFNGYRVRYLQPKVAPAG